MSNGYRNGAFALGLVVGVGIALNLFLWLDYHARSEIESQSSAGQDAQFSQVGKYWDGFVGTFISPSDTLAQWIMAFFTIAATVVLILTLRSANKTNIAAVKASEAALEANQIMRAGNRPWVTLDREIYCEAHDNNVALRIIWNYNFVNKGTTPAFDVRLKWKAMKGVNEMRLPEIAGKFAEKVCKEGYVFSHAALFPGEATNFCRRENFSFDTYMPDRKAITTGIPIIIACIAYRFGPENSQIGYEVSAFSIEYDTGKLGPFAHKLIEYGWVKGVK